MEPDYHDRLCDCRYQHSGVFSVVVLGGHRELTEKQDTVKSAWSQLAACRKKHMQARNGPEEVDVQGILTRSHDISRQSVMLYNQTLQKPWNRIPGFLMGFRQISEGDDG
ncbi:MAG: hypothetical protein PHG94_04850 [Syntrophomonas sp.]|uniref:hypothetical protein n=1 Tax=Syntrophomonas sp. TaxID=2053627 RepID=UPI002636DB07|nr:hypothetical protein [Syntrophomonas sp.]MDD2510438.1 hypothetical protein [Syntrophomonas sp.]MDD4627437.1 hypothetical protein [Syntrophomonas sp.]